MKSLASFILLASALASFGADAAYDTRFTRRNATNTGFETLSIPQPVGNYFARWDTTTHQWVYTLDGSALLSLNATQLTSGTIPNGRFPATYPAGSGVNLTNLNASNLASGTIPYAQLPSLSGDVGTLAGTGVSFINANKINGGMVIDSALTWVDLLPTDPRLNKLSNFTLRQTISSITGVSAGISGATYNPRSGTIFLIRNVSGTDGTIYECDVFGNVIRTINESGWQDTEAIEWIGWDPVNSCDVFAVSEEDHGTAAIEESITLVRLTTGATTLTKSGTGNVSTTTAYSNGNINNSGLESICYDSRRGMIYYTAEFQTAAGSDNTQGTGNAKIFQRSVTYIGGTYSFGAESTLCNINYLFSAQLASGGDIADMAYDAVTDTILLQSDVKDIAIRIPLAGTPVLETLSDPGGQPEGIAISPSGNTIWMVGEAQEWYRYSNGWGDGEILRTVGNRFSGKQVMPTVAGPISNGTNTAGSNLLVQSGTSTGNATPAGIMFATTTAGGSGATEQASLNQWLIAGTGSFSAQQSTSTSIQFVSARGSAGTPGLALPGNNGFYWNNNSEFGVTTGGSARWLFATAGFTAVSDGSTYIGRDPVQGTFNRPAEIYASTLLSAPLVQPLRTTGTNVVGTNLTVRAGLGTGTATPTTIAFYTPDTVGSGTGQQTESVRATISGNGLAVTGHVSSSMQSTTLAAAATTLALTSSYVKLTGDAGANTLATITGGTVGERLTIQFVDALVTLTDTAAATANTLDLSAAFTSTANDTITFIYDGNKWFETARSVN